MAEVVKVVKVVEVVGHLVHETEDEFSPCEIRFGRARARARARARTRRSPTSTTCTAITTSTAVTTSTETSTTCNYKWPLRKAHTHWDCTRDGRCSNGLSARKSGSAVFGKQTSRKFNLAEMGRTNSSDEFHRTRISSCSPVHSRR